MSLGKIIIGKNIKLIRTSIGLSLQDFSIVAEISKTSLVNIEKAKTGYNLNLLEKITTLTGYSLHQLSEERFKPSPNLREDLVLLHSNNLQVKSILTKTPEIVYAVKNKLLSSDFLDKPKEIKEISNFFKKYNWFFKSSAITNALTRMPNKIEVKRHETKKNTNIYLKKH
ncbi:hypothetical protein SRABI27_03762 [Pedobacter sp. Bi27]|uniref:helix-turn-helix domain-containing protein n=1 Tax=Pedobacter sp. Bi27 TaxID=2822351 RepID=UPI001D90F001|nr:helix-turn-helix transcriptional regulator [Pedobacter sp. Bi27]CAH0280567.1 hypothetical protein SRABI27_03762 [Pedobacter sp. Bi27]